MNTKLLVQGVALLAATGLAIEARAQDPLVYPVGVRVPTLLVNELNVATEFTLCPPHVLDASLVPLMPPMLCDGGSVFLGPGGVYVNYWDQADGAGQQVAPGTYFVNGVPIVIDAEARTAITPLGSVRIGLDRALEIASPSTPGAVYVMAASGSSTLGVPLGCGFTFPLDFDALLLQSLSNQSVFASFIGVLDTQGLSTAPHIAVPFVPAFVGISFDVAFAVLDPLVPCGVADVSSVLSLTIEP